MAAVNRILFVCSGNAARSPMAAEILRSLGVTRSRLRHVVVESAGTHASDGERPFDGAIEAMEEIGLSIGGHRARLLTPDLASSYDLILTMDRDQARTVRALGARVEVA
ncbi:MAG: RpiB/LacA/LacB family sugar-phosphate isomerase, partial [Chloroflexi bacterium]